MEPITTKVYHIETLCVHKKESMIIYQATISRGSGRTKAINFTFHARIKRGFIYSIKISTLSFIIWLIRSRRIGIEGNAY